MLAAEENQTDYEYHHDAPDDRVLDDVFQGRVGHCVLRLRVHENSHSNRGRHPVVEVHRDNTVVLWVKVLEVCSPVRDSELNQQIPQLVDIYLRPLGVCFSVNYSFDLAQRKNLKAQVVSVRLAL